MAEIILKGRPDPIIISEERAKLLKPQWLVADKADKIDFGESGAFEAGKIAGINLEGDPFGNKEDVVQNIRTTELKKILGFFEDIYDRHNTGEIIYNPICGPVREGIIEWYLEEGAISKLEEKGGYIYWSVILPKWREFEKKFDAMMLLRYRRAYAKKMEEEGNVSLKKEKTKLKKKLFVEEEAVEPQNDIRVQDIPF